MTILGILGVIFISLILGGLSFYFSRLGYLQIFASDTLWEKQSNSLKSVGIAEVKKPKNWEQSQKKSGVVSLIIGIGIALFQLLVYFVLYFDYIVRG